MSSLTIRMLVQKLYLAFVNINDLHGKPVRSCVLYALSKPVI